MSLFKRKTRKSQNRTSQRVTGFENLEGRRLMAADTLASVVDLAPAIIDSYTPIGIAMEMKVIENDSGQKCPIVRGRRSMDSPLACEGTQDAPSAQQRVPGDLNDDGIVGFQDFLRLSNNFGKSDVSPNDRFLYGDVDGDGDVGFSDFLIQSKNYGNSSTSFVAAGGTFDPNVIRSFKATGYSMDARLEREISCSDDGKFCLECNYKSNGDLLYCDVWILPAVTLTVSEISNDDATNPVAPPRTQQPTTTPGDANMDGEFDSSELVTVFQTVKYETGQAATWSQGDWNGDGLFDSSDVVASLQVGRYEAATDAAFDQGLDSLRNYGAGLLIPRWLPSPSK